MRSAFERLLPAEYIADKNGDGHVLNSVCANLPSSARGCNQLHQDGHPHYATVLFSSRPLRRQSHSSLSTCDDLMSAWRGATTDVGAIAPPGYCDLYLSSGESITSVSACGGKPIAEPGDIGFVSYVLYNFDTRASDATLPVLDSSCPQTHVPKTIHTCDHAPLCMPPSTHTDDRPCRSLSYRGVTDGRPIEARA